MTRATSAIALLALVACSTNNTDSLNADDPIGRIAGQVKSVDGEALPGVEVQVAGVVAVTDADGFYTLEGVTGSSPVSPTIITTLHFISKWTISSVGRAPPLQGGGHWFKPSIVHHLIYSKITQ